MRLIPLRAGYSVTGLRSFGMGTAPSLASAFVGDVLPADVIYIFACSRKAMLTRIALGVTECLKVCMIYFWLGACCALQLCCL